MVLDGGCIALPFLHRVSEINMRTSRLEIERVGPKSVITSDRLRVDVGAEFYVRVDATETGVTTRPPRRWPARRSGPPTSRRRSRASS